MKIAIDGPSGTGKSTIAKILAKELKIMYVDTGAMYRSVGLFLIENNIDLSNEDEIEKILPQIDLNVKFKDNKQIMLLNNRDVNERIRMQDCTDASSKSAVYKCVREKLVSIQREIGQKYNVVMDGRDIGYNILPNADFKFYLDASSFARGQRRMSEFSRLGVSANIDEIIKEIDIRDERDKNRAISPLMQVEDAIYMDTSNMSIEDVRDRIMEIIGE